MAAAVSHKDKLKPKHQFFSKYLKLNSSAVIPLKVTALPEKQNSEWMTEWHFQEVIQLAYEALKRVFEDKRHGISSAHKYHYNFMKGASVRVVFYVRDTPAHCITFTTGKTAEKFKVLPYVLCALADCQSVHSKEGIMKHVHLSDPKEPGSLFVTSADGASKENIPDFEIKNCQTHAKRKGNKRPTIPCSVVNRQIGGKDKTHQGTLDGLLHPATTEQDTQQKPQCPSMPTGTLTTSRPEINDLSNTEHSGNGTHSLQCPSMESLPSDELESTVKDLLKDHKNISAISCKCLIKWIEHRGHYLIEIMNGKVASRRHDEYFSGNKARANLHYEVPLDCFNAKQKDTFVTALTRMFCSTNPTHYNYVMSVLLPEAVVKLVMDVFDIEKLEAEKLLNVAEWTVQ